MQKIWVCGARGQIGQAVNDVVDKLEFEMLDTDVDDLDVTDTDEVLRFGEMNRPDIIINCSGMTDINLYLHVKTCCLLSCTVHRCLEPFRQCRCFHLCFRERQASLLHARARTTRDSR